MGARELVSRPPATVAVGAEAVGSFPGAAAADAAARSGTDRAPRSRSRYRQVACACGRCSPSGKREYVSAILYIIFTENPPPRVTPGKISYLANKDPRSTELEKELANRFLVDTGVTVSVDPQLADPISYPQKVKEYDLVILDAVSVGELSNSLSKLVHSD